MAMPGAGDGPMEARPLVPELIAAPGVLVERPGAVLVLAIGVRAGVLNGDDRDDEVADDGVTSGF